MAVRLGKGGGVEATSRIEGKDLECIERRRVVNRRRRRGLYKPRISKQDGAWREKKGAIGGGLRPVEVLEGEKEEKKKIVSGVELE